MFSSAKVQYLHIEPSEKGTQTNQWENDDANVLSVGVLQMNKLHLLGCKIEADISTISKNSLALLQLD